MKTPLDQSQNNMYKVSIRFAFILGLVGFVTSFGAHVVAVNLPSYIKQVGSGLAMVGLLIADFDLADCCQISSGRWRSRIISGFFNSCRDLL